MTQTYKLNGCPLCGTLKTPAATLCRACYGQAKLAGTKNTGEMKAWIAKQKERNQ